VVAGSVSYITSDVVSSDSNKVSQTTNGFTVSSSGNVDVTFSGIHTLISSTGASVFPAFAVSNGFITDYFGTGNNVPSGSALSITYSVDATGNSGTTPLGFYGSSIISSLMIDGNDVPANCTNGAAANNFNGLFATTCSVIVPISSLDVISIELLLHGFVDAVDGTATLDAKNTAKISSLLVLDASGNPIPIQLYDASGFDYNATVGPPPVVTPEPSNWILFGTGILGLARFVGRKFLCEK